MQDKTTHELLAEALGGPNDGDAARKIIDAFQGNLRTLALATPEEMAASAHVTVAKARRVAAIIALGLRASEARLAPGARMGGSADVFRHYHGRLRDQKREFFLALLLDGKHRLIEDYTVSIGCLTASLVHPREAFAPAIKRSASAIVFVHNHPSGDSAPSREDIDLTRRLVAVGDLLGIRVLDHIIIGDGRYYSFIDNGRITQHRDSDAVTLAAGS